MDRRGFLRTGAGGAAAVLLASLLPGACSPGYADTTGQGEPLRSLSPREYAVALAAAEALLIGLPVEPARVATAMDRELSLVGGAIERDMKTVLTLLEHLTPLGLRLSPFSRLSPEARLRYLETWRDSRFSLRRAAFNAVRSFVYFYAYADPATWSITNFPGPWPGRVHIPATPVDFGEIA